MISRGIGIIIKARKYLNRKSLLDLYHAFVYPYLTYCIEVWGNLSSVHLWYGNNLFDITKIHYILK